MTTAEDPRTDAGFGLPSGVILRPYRGPEELAGMAAANDRLRAAAGQLEPVTEASMRHGYAHLVHSDPLVDAVIAERDGVTVGYARVEWHELADGDRTYDFIAIVDPTAHGLGLAEALVTWAERRLMEVMAATPTDRRCWLSTWVFDADAELIAALRARGYEAARWFAEMLRDDLDDVDDLAAVDLPAGYAFRPTTLDDMPAVHAMSVAAFAEHWGEWEGDEETVEEWTENPLFRLDLVVVPWAGDEPAAFASARLEAAPDGRVRGYVDGVATHPGHRRRGLARAALAENLRRLRAAGATSAYLGVDTDNATGAGTLYASLGFRQASGSAAYRRPAPKAGVNDDPPAAKP